MIYTYETVMADHSSLSFDKHLTTEYNLHMFCMHKFKPISPQYLWMGFCCRIMYIKLLVSNIE